MPFLSDDFQVQVSVLSLIDLEAVQSQKALRIKPRIDVRSFLTLKTPGYGWLGRLQR